MEIDREVELKPLFINEAATDEETDAMLNDTFHVEDETLKIARQKKGEHG